MKNILLGYFFIFLLGMTACFDDDSKSGITDVSDIEIEGLRDTSIISYNGSKLEIFPKIKTDYPEEKLSYAWYMYSTKEAGEFAAGFENGYHGRKIAEGKNLSYEVNLPSDTYTFIFEVVSNENEYTKTATMKVAVVTAYSKGFYILKEDESGDTELDLFNQNGLRENLMKKLLGASLAGKPKNLCVTQNHPYIDDETQKMGVANVIHVFTDKNEFRAFRTEDMVEVFNRSNLLFEGMAVDEAPCSMIRATFGIYYISNKGVYVTSAGDYGGGSGKFGIPNGNGGSQFVQPAGDPTASLFLWNEGDHHLDLFDGSTVSSMNYEDKMPIGMIERNLECISCGINFVGSEKMVYFLCEDQASGTRYLYLIAGVGQDEVTEIRKLDAELHIAQGEQVAGNALTASVIYTIHNNRLWAYNWDSGEEFEVPLPGIGSGELLAFVSNQYLNIGFMSNKRSENFNNLIIGTQNGNQYKLYFYDSLVGASPVREAKDVICGVGQVKCVRYATSLLFDMNDLMSFDAPSFPYYN